MKSLGLRVDIAGDGVGTEDMRGEWIQARRAVSEEEGESDGRKRVGVGVRGRVRENHCHQRPSNGVW